MKRPRNNYQYPMTYIAALEEYADHIESQLKDRDDILNEIDHAESCMCRSCCPEFHEFKQKEK